MSEQDNELPAITPRGGPSGDAKMGSMKEVYDSHIDGPPAIGKSTVDDDLMFGKPKNKVENKSKENAKDETGQKSMDMTEDEGLIGNGGVSDCKEDHNKGISSIMDMALFSYDSASLAHYDTKNPESAKWKTQKKVRCMLGTAVCLGMTALVLIFSLGQMGQIKNVKYDEEVVPNQKFKMDKDTMPLQHVTIIKSSKSDMVSLFHKNGASQFSGTRRLLAGVSHDSEDPTVALTAADTNGDGSLDLDEYKAKYSTKDADAPGGAIEVVFNKFDTNTDGAISADEFAAAVSSITGSDADGDSYLDQAEFRQYLISTLRLDNVNGEVDDFAMMDAKKNRKVSLEELKSDLTNHAVIKTYDTDADKQLNKAELQAFLVASGQPTDGLDAMFARIDMNGDDKISLSEQNKEVARQVLFTLADTDGNKEVSLEELKAQPLMNKLRFFFKEQDADGSGGLSIDEFAKLLVRKSYADNKCTILQELDPLYVDKVQDCLSVPYQECWNAAESKYDNSMCGNAYDSCAKVITDQEMAPCVNSHFCTIFPDVSPKLTFNGKAITGMSCEEVKLTPEEKVEANEIEAARLLAVRMEQEDFPLFYGMIIGALPKTELLDFNSYLAGLQIITPTLTEAIVKPQFDAADTDTSGSLDFNEFKVALAANRAALKLAEDLNDPDFQAYYAMDLDHDNKLTFAEFKTAALISKPDAVEATLQEFYDASDADGDLGLSFDEYMVSKVKIQERAALELRIATDTVFAEFYRLDTSKNLELTFDELKVKFPGIAEDKLKRDYDTADTVVDASMNYEEYTAFLAIRLVSAELEAKLAADPELEKFYNMQTAAPYDFLVSLAEYIAAAKVTEPAATDEELTARFNAVDESSAGEINYEAFKKLEVNKLAADVASGNDLQVRIDQDPIFSEFYTISGNNEAVLTKEQYSTDRKAKHAWSDPVITKLFDDADTVEPTGELNYDEFVVVKAAEKAKAALDVKLTDPVYAEFYNADTADARDELLSVEELTAANAESSAEDVQKWFTAADADVSGGLTEVEYAQFKVQKLGSAELAERLANDPEYKKFYDKDTDKDDKVTLAEWTELQKVSGLRAASEATLSAQFGQGDTDGDSLVSWAEYGPLMALLKQQQTELDAKLEDTGYAKFYRADKSDPKDTAVSSEEWAAWFKLTVYAEADDSELKKVFDACDGGSGSLDAEQFKTAVAKAEEEAALKPPAGSVPGQANSDPGVARADGSREPKSVKLSELKDHICNNFVAALHQKVDGAEYKFEMDCNLVAGNDGNYVVHHTMKATYSKEFETKRNSRSGHKVIVQPKGGVTGLVISSSELVHSSEKLDLTNVRKSLDGEKVQGLAHSGEYSMGQGKPSDANIRFRAESKTEDGEDKTALKIYETAGESKMDTAVANRRRLAEGDADPAQQSINFKFDFTVKKFGYEYFTFADCISNLGGLAAIFALLFYMVGTLMGICTVYSFFQNLGGMIARKYNEASEWKKIQKMMSKFRKIHIAMCNLHQFKEIINEIEAFQKIDFDNLTYVQMTQNLGKMKILDQKLPNIDDIEIQFSKFEMSEAEKARSAEIDAIIEKRCKMSFSEIFHQIKDRVSFFGVYNLYDEIEMNDVQLRAEIKIQNAKLEFLYQALAQRRRNNKKKSTAKE